MISISFDRDRLAWPSSAIPAAWYRSGTQLPGWILILARNSHVIIPRLGLYGSVGARHYLFGTFREEQYGADEEADRADEGLGVGLPGVVHLAGDGVDVPGHGGDAERDGPGQVDQRDPPRPRPRPPGGPAVADLVPGQDAGDEEADRPDRVGPPHVLVDGLRRQVGRHRDPAADVEVQGAGELHRGGPPVDPPPLVDEKPPVRGVQPRRGSVDRLPVGQERGRGEEQRAGEVGDRIPPGPDRAGIPGY